MNLSVTSLIKYLGNESERKKSACYWVTGLNLKFMLVSSQSPWDLNPPAYIVSGVSYMRDPLPAGCKD